MSNSEVTLMKDTLRASKDVMRFNFVKFISLQAKQVLQYTKITLNWSFFIATSEFYFQLFYPYRAFRFVIIIIITIVSFSCSSSEGGSVIISHRAMKLLTETGA